MQISKISVNLVLSYRRKIISLYTYSTCRKVIAYKRFYT